MNRLQKTNEPTSLPGSLLRVGPGPVGQLPNSLHPSCKTQPPRDQERTEERFLLAAAGGTASRINGLARHPPPLIVPGAPVSALRRGTDPRNPLARFVFRRSAAPSRDCAGAAPASGFAPPQLANETETGSSEVREAAQSRRGKQVRAATLPLICSSSPGLKPRDWQYTFGAGLLNFRFRNCLQQAHH